MKEWCLTHPWMTFLTICFAIYCISLTIENLLTVINNRIKVSYAKVESDNKKSN